MIKRLKNKLIKFLLGYRIQPSYDDLTYDEKIKCNELWRDHSNLMKKIVKIVIGSVIQEYAKNDKEIEYAKEILTLQNDLIESFHDLIKEEKRKKNIVDVIEGS